jgi:NADH:ubiquinone oxidoreductase subunit 5 (subunit L)/multisubunit Na+/H+ antiporter MnhA subunit
LSLIVGLIAAVCTAYYSTKLIFLAFYTMPLGYKNRVLHAQEPGIFMVCLWLDYFF